MTKKINRIIPRTMKPIGEKLAEIHCRTQGIYEGTDGYEEEFNRAIYRFNDEAWGLSMTPSGLIGQNPQINGLKGQNPATSKIEPHYFDLMSKTFGEKGFIAKVSKDNDEALKLDRQLRGLVASIAHRILESKYGLTIKGKESAFSFKESMGSEKDSRDQNGKSVLAHYLRLYYGVQITKALEKLFLSEKVELGSIIMDVFGEDFDWQNTYASLNPKEMRETFVSELYSGKTLKQVTSKPVSVGVNNAEFVGPRMQKKTNPSHAKGSLDVYYSHDEALYFDKNKIDSYIEENQSNCNQIVPRKGYMKINPTTKEEVENASMSNPVVFGTIKKNGKDDNFLILGHAQILKANKLGLPMIDCLVLDANETFKMIRRTTKTNDRIKEIRETL